jgi:hypothetical protein
MPGEYAPEPTKSFSEAPGKPMSCLIVKVAVAQIGSGARDLFLRYPNSGRGIASEVEP